jgi:hypothetical protein
VKGERSYGCESSTTKVTRADILAQEVAFAIDEHRIRNVLGWLSLRLLRRCPQSARFNCRLVRVASPGLLHTAYSQEVTGRGGNRFGRYQRRYD